MSDHEGDDEPMAHTKQPTQHVYWVVGFLRVGSLDDRPPQEPDDGM
jgi:hypothetical protein